jgi:hypothetical protein
MILKLKVIIIFVVLCILINSYLFVNTDWFNNNQNVSTTEKIVDAVFFSLYTTSGTGYGNLVPEHMYAKIIVSIQLVALILLTFDIFIYYLQKR